MLSWNKAILAWPSPFVVTKTSTLYIEYVSAIMHTTNLVDLTFTPQPEGLAVLPEKDLLERTRHWLQHAPVYTEVHKGNIVSNVLLENRDHRQVDLLLVTSESTWLRPYGIV